jgi:chorismate lyase / 3-hydroxybenzoate synthase
MNLPPPLPAAVAPRLYFGPPEGVPADALGVVPLVAGQAPLPVLSPPLCGAWLGTGAPVQRGRHDGFDYAADGTFLFATLRLPDEADLDTLAFNAYRRVDAFLAAQGYPHPLRIWNYFPNIHEGPGDAERYRQFCVGRFRALSQRADFEQRLCATTVIGTQGDALLITLLAAKAPGIPVENPRQIPAYRYPREHGPRSPSFARATLVGNLLLVSGTASIVGHQTQHADDAAKQMDEILANLRSLLDQASQHVRTPGRWLPSALRLYVRDPADADRSAAVIGRMVEGINTPITVLRGDVCREELLVEVEGVFEK